MPKLKSSCKAFLLALVTAIIAGGCTDMDKVSIAEVLDQRNAAITDQNAAAYSALIYGEYSDQGKSKVDIVAQTIRIFDRFEKTRMQSHDRTIRVPGDGTAECEQSYILEAFADGHWRKIIQRERIYFIETEEGWKISGGL